MFLGLDHYYYFSIRFCICLRSNIERAKDIQCALLDRYNNKNGILASVIQDEYHDNTIHPVSIKHRDKCLATLLSSRSFALSLILDHIYIFILKASVYI